MFHGKKQKKKKKGLWPKSIKVLVAQSCPTPQTVARQAPPSIAFSRQECWIGLPYPSPGDISDQGTEPGSPTLQVDSFFFFFFSSTSLLLPTHLPPLSCTHAQSCKPMDLSPPGSSVCGFFQARMLEGVAISFSMQVDSLLSEPQQKPSWLKGNGLKPT